jgi:membrane protein
MRATVARPLKTIGAAPGTAFAISLELVVISDSGKLKAMFGLAQIWSMLEDAASDWVEDKAPQLGAALAFYSVLSVAPLLVIAISIASLVYGEEGARGQMLLQAENMVGKDEALAIREMLEHAQKPGSGIFATVLGIATLLLGASGVFGQLQDAMNTIWEVPAKKGNSIWNFVRARFLSFAMVLGTGFLLLVSLILSALISGAGEYLSGQIPGSEPIMHLATALVSFLLVSILFAMIFKLLPDTQVEWRDVWTGAVLTPRYSRSASLPLARIWERAVCHRRMVPQARWWY